MASVVDICNYALGLLGDRATVTSIDPPEGSAQADHCAQFWPLARDAVLSSDDWRFCSTTVELVALDDSLNDHPAWRYAYALPNDMLVAREMLAADGVISPLFGPDAIPFELAQTGASTPVLFCNYEAMSLRFTKRLTSPLRYPPKLVDAMGYMLAAYLAGPVVKGRSGAQLSATMRQAANALVREAAVVDANQRRASTKFTPASVRARGTVLAESTVESGVYRRELPFWAV